MGANHSNNRVIMESILAHLRKLILMTELGEEDKLKDLTNMACEVSNTISRIENGEYIDMIYESDQLDDNESLDDDSEDEDETECDE